jgi:hypothetical protein
MNTLSTTPSATGLRDCERAAAAVEECLALLETGPTAVQLALNQVSGSKLGQRCNWKLKPICMDEPI